MKKSILDPKFKYIPSHATNVRETFERIRKEQDQAKKLGNQPYMGRIIPIK